MSRLRQTLRWCIGLVFAALVAVSAVDRVSSDPEEPEARATQGRRLRIRAIKPLETHAGSAVVVSFEGGPSSGPITAELNKQAAAVLHQRDDRVVVRIPPDADEGTTKLRLRRGDSRSKPMALRIKKRRLGKVLRSLVGGLALFVLGLRTLSRGMRGYAGRPLRIALGRWVGRPWRSVLFGLLAGAIAQSLLPVAGVAFGLVKSRLLARRSALLALVAAHVGASGAVLLLPLDLSREALWIVALGVLQLVMARGRRGAAAGKVVLGLGLLFYGLGELRSGFLPLVGDPEVLPYLQTIQRDGLGGAALRLGAGAVLGVALPGPAAAFALLQSVGEATGQLAVGHSATILLGAALGLALATLGLALPVGARSRQVARAHLLAAVGVVAVGLASAGVFEALGEQVFALDVTELRHGKKVLVPDFAKHLALTYVGALATGAGAVALYLTYLRGASTGATAGTASAEDPDPATPLAEGLRADTELLDAVFEALSQGTGGAAATAEARLGAVRELAHRALDRSSRGEEPEVAADPRVALVALLHLQKALEVLLRLSERGLQQDFAVDARWSTAFQRCHDHVRDSVARLAAHVGEGAELQMEEVRAREIELNGLEAEFQQALLDGQGSAAVATAWASEVLAAYESVGNQCYRLAEALSDDDDL